VWLTRSLSVAQLQTSSPQTQPTPQELSEMTHRASEVVRLLESLRTPTSAVSSSTATSTTMTGGEFPVLTIGVSSSQVTGAGPSSASMDVDTRAPKRPWEETQTQPHGTHSGSFPSAPTGNMSGAASGAERTAAEKDMELIRTKRAMTANLAAAAAAANGGAGGGGSGAGGAMGGATSMGGGGGSSKNKYRKRSVRCPFFVLFQARADSGTYSGSVQHHLESVIRVISGRHRSGDVDQMGRGRFAMLVGSVRGPFPFG